MTNYLKINHQSRTLVMDRTFAKNAAYVGAREYTLLQEARRDYPEYQVITRTIKKKANKECYRGLTYEYMENYIACHDNAETLMKEYWEERLTSECHSVRYPNVKKWFLEKYPDVAKFGMAKNEKTSIDESKAENVLSIVKGEAELQAA